MREQRIIDLTDPNSVQRAPPPAEVIAQWRANFAWHIDRMQAIVRNTYLHWLNIAYQDWSRYRPHEHYAAWDGGRDRYGKNREPVWPHVVRHFVRIGASPQDYISSQLNGTGAPRNPTPLQMLTREATDHYQAVRRDGDPVQDLRREWEYANRDARWEAESLIRIAKWEREKAYNCALANAFKVSAGPLVRYCLGAQERLRVICEGFQDDALCLYAFAKNDCDAALGVHIPFDFREAGGALVVAILSDQRD